LVEPTKLGGTARMFFIVRSFRLSRCRIRIHLFAGDRRKNARRNREIVLNQKRQTLNINIYLITIRTKYHMNIIVPRSMKCILYTISFFFF